MCKEEKIFYKSLDGIRLCGIFTLPDKPKGFALMAHGITMDKNEWNDFYVEISHELCKNKIASLRFDFRAHGESEGLQRELTVIGELLDIKASAKKIMEKWKGKISIIATSFGAGPAILYTAQNPDVVNCLILLCPVLDYEATFLNPIVPWAKESFNEKGFKDLEEKGFLLLDGVFEIGTKMVEEFRIIKPYKYLKKIKCPVLTIHGDMDSMVPYEISKKYGSPNEYSKFITLKGADHGFVAYDDETGESEQSQRNKKLVIKEIIQWIEKWGVSQ